MAKLDDVSVVELLKELSDKLAGGEPFDDALAWQMVNDKVQQEAKNAPPKKKSGKKEYMILLSDPDGKLPADVTGWIIQKDKEAVVDETSPTDGSSPQNITAWSDDDHQAAGLLEIAHETLMDDNENAYAGKGFADMLKHGKKTLKACGIIIKSQEVEAFAVRNDTVPLWKTRTKADDKAKK